MADFLFGSPGSGQKPIIYSGIQVSTSAYDLPVQWLRGQRRISSNLIDYVDFKKHKQSAKGKGGGKGGGQYTYSAAVILGLGFGVMDSILNVWAQGSSTTTTTLAALGFTLNSGTALQSPWAFMVSAYPSHALAYANMAILLNPNLDMGSSASVPDLGFEGRQIPYSDYLETAGWTNPTTSANTPGRDVNMADFLPDALQDPLVFGGFDSGDIPDLTAFREYQAAQGLFFSPYLSKQEKATDIINRWAKIANTWIYWSGTAFVVVPLGDTALTANGYTYTPDLAVDYALGPADFVSNPPVKVDIKDGADCANRTTVTIIDRTMGYVTNPIEYKSESLIRRYGRREAENIQADDIACPAVGNIVAQLIGRRNAHLTKTYSFKTSWRFVRALPGSIFSLTDPTQGLDGELVRITEVEEDENGNLTWSAEELPTNIATYHARNIQEGPSPATPDQLVDPGDVNTPAVVEPAQAGVVDTSTVLIAASGGPNWGGANVWISFDGTSYSNIGKINNAAIQGVLTADLAAYGGTNPDTGNTLSVDCTISQGEPEPVTNADADALRTLSLVCAPATPSGGDLELDSAGELLAFGAESTTGTYAADLTYHQRGQLGTAPGAHVTDDLFTLFDLSGISGSTLQYRLPAQYVGQPIWLKLASFNLFGKNTQDLSVCQSYKYTPAGTGFGSGSGGVPGTPTGLAATGGNLQVALSWNANPATDNVSGYEIYRAAGTGAAFGSASLIAVVAGQAYTDSNLPVSTGYTYFLKAENAIGLSAATGGANVTTSSTPIGDFVGPASSTADDFVQFAGTTGKLGKDGGLSRDTDGTLAANSDTKIPSQKAVKTYIDAKLAGLSWKQAVRAATTAGGTLASSFENGDSIDGVTLATGDRILIKNQATAADNGIYVVAASGAPARATDADSGAELVNASCYVSEGTANADTQWCCTTNAPITLGATSLAFAQLSSGGATASTTEQLTGTDSSKSATADSVAALWEQGADVASAGTTSLGEGGFFHITGTTTITDIDFATDKAGRKAWVEFTGALLLTHNGSTLILPTGANITTAAGDTACFVSEGSDVVRCVAYIRSDGTALVATDATLSTSDITTNNVSPSKHGFAPKAPNDATKYLDGTGGYSVPPGSGGGGGTGAWWNLLQISTAAFGSQNLATYGNLIAPQQTLKIYQAAAYLTTVTGGTYRIGIAPYDAGTNKITSAPTYSNTYTEAAGAAGSYVPVTFAGGVTMLADTLYVVFFTRTDSTATVATVTNGSANNIFSPGIIELTASRSVVLASVAPTTSDTWSRQTGFYFIDLSYQFA
jgi:hypothetical protein